MLVAVFLSISILITGVVLLSLKSSAKTASDPYTVSTEPSTTIRLRPQLRNVSSGSNGPAKPNKEDDEEEDEPGPHVQLRKEEVLWEVGSVSDESDRGDKEDEALKKGLGGGGHGGERRGLLDEEGENEAEGGPSPSRPRHEDSADDFGEYKGVKGDDEFSSTDSPSRATR